MSKTLKEVSDQIQKIQERKKEIAKKEERTRGIISSFSRWSRIGYLKRVCSINTNVFYTLGFGKSITTDKTLKQKYLKILRENVAKDYPNSYHVWRLEPRLSDGEPHLHILANIKDKEGNYSDKARKDFCKWVHALWEHHVDDCDEGFEEPVDCRPATDHNIKKYSAKDTENSHKEHEWSPTIIYYWEKDAGNRWGSFPRGGYDRLVIGPRSICLNKKQYKLFIEQCIAITQKQINTDNENGYDTTKQDYYLENLSNKSDNVLFCLNRDEVRHLEEHLFGNSKLAKRMLF